jgi:hypothetical protein
MHVIGGRRLKLCTGGGGVLWMHGARVRRSEMNDTREWHQSMLGHGSCICLRSEPARIDTRWPGVCALCPLEAGNYGGRRAANCLVVVRGLLRADI